MNRIAVIDTETGGLDPSKHSLLSVSIITTTEHFEPLEDFTVFIKSDEYVVTQKALATNMIDIVQSNMWTDADTAKRQIASFLKFDQSVLDPNSNFNTRDKWRFIGKNPSFDRGFLEAFFTKQILDRMFMYWTECVFREYFLPLQRLGAFKRPASGQLADVCIAAGVDVDTTKTHSSEYDARITVDLLRKCREVERRISRVMTRPRTA